MTLAGFKFKKKIIARYKETSKATETLDQEEEQEEEEQSEQTILEALPEAETYLQPYVDSIDIRGQVLIVWNATMLREPNNTYFEERMKRIVRVRNIDTQVVIEVPAFEVEFVDQDNRDVPISIDWSWLGWTSQTEMKLQLYFNNTKAVSMEQPRDQVMFRFWDQSLFLSSDPTVRIKARNLRGSRGEVLLEEDIIEISDGDLYVNKQYEMISHILKFISE